MLHEEAVAAATLELIRALQKKKYFEEFHLVGGTALALYYGHRQSFDIDLFTNTSFDEQYLLENLINDFSFQMNYSAQQTLKGSVKGINLDVISHAYKNIEEPTIQNGITILSEKDILAMKLNAISISGQRSKDFVDIYFALKHYSIKQLLSFYAEKYQQENITHIIKSLVYFDDVDLSDWPTIKEPGLTWSVIERQLNKEVIKFMSGN